jgi:predicted oxidoreductase
VNTPFLKLASILSVSTASGTAKQDAENQLEQILHQVGQVGGRKQVVRRNLPIMRMTQLQDMIIKICSEI